MRFAPREHVSDTFEINDKKISFERPKDFRNPPSYSKNDIVAKWGQPSKTGFRDNCSYITYRDGFTWNVIGIIILIIPIPILIFPTGFDEKKIYFLDDKNIAYSENFYNDTHFFGYLCDDRSCRFQFGKTYHYSENERKLLQCVSSEKID
ncbi:hypothetical protein [Leptospira neocaledonica]|uniref:hypothetical protein n=1 Tax=Leptospira neocaledonica TaxID=2023192 RepID=UPI001AD846E5|nr:hypothetical protein [Leptospira neocaledonica]